MAKDANDVHRELGIDGLRKHGDGLPDLDFDMAAPKEGGNGLATAGSGNGELKVLQGAGDSTALEIARLAKLRLADHERERKAAGEKLGVRAPILDQARFRRASA